MKKYFVMMFALSLGAGAANAQEVTNTETVEATEQTQTVSLCKEVYHGQYVCCLLYTSPSPRDAHESRMPASA